MGAADSELAVTAMEREFEQAADETEWLELTASSPLVLLTLGPWLYDLDREWDATIWVKNLTDEDYATNVIQGQDYYSRNMGMPRTFGASLTYRFN